jgi:hypothetical protein
MILFVMPFHGQNISVGFTLVICCCQKSQATVTMAPASACLFGHFETFGNDLICDIFPQSKHLRCIYISNLLLTKIASDSDSGCCFRLPPCAM